MEGPNTDGGRLLALVARALPNIIMSWVNPPEARFIEAVGNHTNLFPNDGPSLCRTL